MKDPKTIKYSDMDVILRKDFYEKFGEHLKQITEDTGAIYFGHNLIKNYREKGHKISTFCTHENWHEIYWDKYRNTDPIDRIIHQVVQKNDFGVISWVIGHNGSACSQERIKLTNITEGITMSFKRPGNYFETMAIGWKDLDPDQLDIEYISHLSSLLKPLRDFHWDVHNKV
jgi:hypothetical protein